MNFVDVQALAGAWDLGTTQAGFQMKHRVAVAGGFGNEVVDANRDMLNFTGEQETGDCGSWTPQSDVSFVLGTPPCSGFSLLNSAKGSNARGPESAINNCMKELITYAAKCTGRDGKQGPEIVSFESVQGAYSQGRVLMQLLRDKLSTETGQEYGLTHVLMSGSSVGNAQMRHRYYFVAHRIPFGVDHPLERKVVTYHDAIGDLIGTNTQWDAQPYPNDTVSSYSSELRSARGTFTDHVPLTKGRNISIIEDLWEDWPIGYSLPEAIYHTGRYPKSLQNSYDPDSRMYKGWSWPVKVNPDRPGYVLTGGGIHGFVHWAEPRLLTVRECSRLMGYPDDWKWPTTSENQASAWIGKNCPVTSGRWISRWARKALEGTPGTEGELIGSNEKYFNCTLDYRKWPGGKVPKRGRIETAHA